MPSPVDGTVWGTLQAAGPDQPGAVVRINLGPNPPETALSEIYNVPLPRVSAAPLACRARFAINRGKASARPCLRTFIPHLDRDKGPVH